jgi:hypothetical protein
VSEQTQTEDGNGEAPQCPGCGQLMLAVPKSWYWPVGVDIFRCDRCNLFKSRPNNDRGGA